METTIQETCRDSERNANEVKLVAVSKYRPIEQTRVLYELGIRDFGESRVQEAQAKAAEMPKDVVWHMIGRLQTNKVKYLPEFASWIHSLDRWELAEKIQRVYEAAGKTVHVFVQVNVSGEESKTGLEPEDTQEFVKALQNQCSALKVEGLMTMAPYDAEPAMIGKIFAQLREMQQRFQQNGCAPLPHLSMGMSNDYPIAIREGSTMIRVGSRLYEPGS